MIIDTLLHPGIGKNEFRDLLFPVFADSLQVSQIVDNVALGVKWSSRIVSYKMPNLFDLV